MLKIREKGARYLTDMINIFLATQVYHNRREDESYRHISLLSHVAKLLEKLLPSQLNYKSPVRSASRNSDLYVVDALRY